MLRIQKLQEGQGGTTLAFSACWGVSPILTEYTINGVSTPPAEVDKITGQTISVPVIFLW